MGTVAILSPHLDDAVFSCWHVLVSSRDVVVINVFAGVPDSGKPAALWDRITGADDSAQRMRVRLEEDERGLALARRRAENLDFLDSQYRDEPPRGILATLQDRLPEDAELFAPAGIGGHSDHELVRDAALSLAADGREVSLYADVPYATEFGWPAWVTGSAPDPFRDVDAHWAEFVPAGYRPTPVELGEEQQRAKTEAMRMYRTQFATLEAGGLRRLTHPDVVRFEVVWTKSR